MADFAISSGDYMRPFRLSGSAPVEFQYGPESTTQAYPVGALLELDSLVSSSNFRLAKAVVSASTVTSTSIIGVAAEPASSVFDTTRLYWPVSPSIEFQARTRGKLLASTCIGQPYGLFFDSTKAVYGVDLANQVSTSQRVLITGLIDAVGDSGGYVRFKFGTQNSTMTFGGGANPLRY